MEAQTFAKAERLHSKKLIQELFTKGSSFYLHPFKVLILIHPNQTTLSHEILISVSKRNFKKAVHRNLIKRRIREVYRMEKHLLQSNPKLVLAFIYTAKTILSLPEIKQGLATSLKRVNQRLPTSGEPNTPAA
jgi:ribonuclease P protein component